MKQKKYVFIKDYVTKDGVIREGSDLISFRGFLYLNGGMILPAYSRGLYNLLDNKTLASEYLKEVEIIRNKA
ncbi:MAG: hypothetical protein IKT40_08950 [Bacilli bacterium]|nr:hypothetical protein [Bacilli bacterium]